MASEGGGDLAGLAIREDAEREITLLVRTLAATTLLLWLGASAIIPLLPAYLSSRGGSDTTVGIVMASYFLASLICQYCLLYTSPSPRD